jgi:hypothetical protein
MLGVIGRRYARGADRAAQSLRTFFLMLKKTAEKTGDGLPGGCDHRQRGSHDSDDTLKKYVSGARIQVRGGVRDAGDRKIQQHEAQQDVF